MKILQVGCGGVGSWLAEEVARAFNEQQIGHSVDYWIADNDIVEVNNIKYQNFTDRDIGKNKADVLGKRYVLEPSIHQRIGETSELRDFDLFVLCVDNNKTREFIFRYCYENNRQFIDLRAEGKRIFAMQKSADVGRTMEYSLEKDLGTLNLADKENGSCQLKSDLEKGIIQKGNKIASSIGIQMLLNFIRGEKNRTIVLNL